MSFVQLQVISAYSLLRSTTSIENLVVRAKELGYQALALTDINALYGVADFYKACVKHQIKPILGLTIELPGVIQIDQTYQMVFLAKNDAGYSALMALSTRKMQEASLGQMTVADIAPYASNLVAITPGENGEIEQALLVKDENKAQKIIAKWLDVLNTENFYLGAQVHRPLLPIKEQLLLLAKQNNLKTVGMHDVRYLNATDDFSTKVLRAIDQNERVNLSIESTSGSYYLPSPEHMVELFTEQGLAEAGKETICLAESLEVKLVFHQHLLPRYPLEIGETSTAKLRELCLAGLDERLPALTQAYAERLDYELRVIEEMGFNDYFLIVWDVMNYAHQQRIVTGAGRGSAAGSLVSYALRITDIDPIKYQLLFERFLNKERFTMPDIDLDFPDNKREQVLNYVGQKYGKEHVAQIATFGTLAAKMALRDVARVFGLSQNEANVWSKTIPRTLGITLEKAYEESRNLRQLVAENDKNKLLFDTAKRIEGLPRHVSTHAAGVVISDQPLVQLIPLQEGGEHVALTQFAMGNVEEIGLLKMDFLGLKNLSILANAMYLVKRDFNIQIDLDHLPLDDDQTLELFRKGATSGVFQFESAGIKNVLRKLGPTSIEDVAAVNALYRPGPMENIDTFINRKKGLEPIVYPHDSLKDILGVTYGVMVYQEQIMQIASRMAGFSLGQADILRRAISKKKKEVLDEERQHFVSGALDQGYEAEVANNVYNWIERFANYGFNRSHAVAYSVIAYQLAYMKAHYPAAFFASILNAVLNHSSKMKEYILEAKKYQIAVLPPNVNESDYHFTMHQGAIQFGLGSIKGIRRDFVLALQRERENNGKFKDFIEFTKRMDQKWMKEEVLRPLIYVGAFDTLGITRKDLIASLPGILDNLAIMGGLDLGSEYDVKYKLLEQEYTLEEKLDYEETYLGAFVSGHPVEQYDEIRSIRNMSFIGELNLNKREKVLGFIKHIKLIRTKKGEQMAFLTLSDVSGDLTIVLFPTVYRKYIQLIEKGKIVTVEGKTESNRQQDDLQMIGDVLVDAEIVKAQIEANPAPKKQEICYIKIPIGFEKLTDLQAVLQGKKGQMPVVLRYEQDRKTLKLSESQWVQADPELIESVEALVGKGNVIVR